MKLYLVKCRGMNSMGLSGFGTAYAVAEDPTTAYAMIRADLDKRDIGFRGDREMNSVTLVAEEGEYPACPNLYLPSTNIKK